MPLLVAMSLLLARTASEAEGIAAVGMSPPPSIDSRSYVLMDYDSGEILASADADVPLPPASLTKMMTSYLVEQALKVGSLRPDDQVRVSENARCHGSGAQSCMHLPPDARASLRDILKGIIIQSGDDAAEAAAEHMAGSEAAFAQLMNGEAGRIGMLHSHFVNSTGLPAPGHQASAHDLALLARTIIHDSADYYPIYAERDFTYNGIKHVNRNTLLFTDPSVDGLIAGHTGEAGFCLTASAKRDGLRIISVVMGAPTDQELGDETGNLFTWGFDTFAKTRPYRVGAVVTTATVDAGVVNQVPVGLAHDWALTVPRDQPKAVQTSFQFIQGINAPIAKGQILGTVVATLNGKWFSQVPLVAMIPVERAGLLQRSWQRIRQMFKRS